MSINNQNPKTTAPQGGQSANHCYTEFDHIPNSEINKDIIATKIEIDNYEDELQILIRNPSENKSRIYLLKGKILPRKDFVEKLNNILSYRKQNV